MAVCERADKALAILCLREWGQEEARNSDGENVVEKPVTLIKGQNEPN